jgi:hypothetical protein
MPAGKLNALVKIADSTDHHYYSAYNIAISTKMMSSLDKINIYQGQTGIYEHDPRKCRLCLSLQQK